MVLDKKAFYLTATPTIDTAIYASGDRLGSLMTLSNVADETSGIVVLKSLIITDQAAQTAGIDVLFFDSAPTIASADNAALNITDAEMTARFIGRVVVATGDFTALSANSVAVKANIELMMRPLLGTRDLYCLLQSRGTPTYGATTALTVKFLFEQY
jgi:hypothetical protein